MSGNFYSDVTTSSTARAHFTRHQVHEVATSLTESKQVARDLSENERYPFRAKAILLGDVDVTPYDAIYLDNLPGGMSGYWTVLSVNHIFGQGITYQLEVELGTDVLGLTNANANRGGYRDVEAELAGAGASNSPVYVDALFLPGLSNDNAKYGVVKPTSATTSVTSQAPDFSIIRRQAAWRAQ
jgi:hypothetical protein